MKKTVRNFAVRESTAERWRANTPNQVCKRWPIHLSASIGIALLLVLTRSAAAVVPTNPPILISESTSTRAIALEPVTLTREPFSLHSPFLGALHKNRSVMVFAMNLELQAGENLSVVSADAEDATHTHHALVIESVQPVPACEWMSAVVFKLDDEMGDVGDVLVSVSYHSLVSNRVRIAIGHMGGGLADDPGAAPTLAPPYTISGQLRGNAGQGLSGFSMVLSGTQTGTLVTGADGSYAITVTKVGDYTLTPVANPYYTFSAQTFTNLHFNQVANFPGTLLFYTLSGRVVDQSANAVGGVPVSLTGSATTTTRTAADGSYSLTTAAGGNYTLRPSTPQNFTFGPPVVRFNNLVGSQRTDFIATLLPSPSYVLEYDGAQKTVDYGNFWNEGVDLGHFFWEFWAMPGNNAGGTYLLSDGYGGAHALLFGFFVSEANRYQLSGNIFDGVNHDNSFGSDQGPAAGEWGHFAVGWDGQNIVTYYNGVPVGRAPFAGPRRTPGPVQGGGRLLIGGSDHSNFNGRIAQVRGYENANPREAVPGGVEASFAPQSLFSVDGNLLSLYFQSSGTHVADQSNGYNGIRHEGLLRGTAAGILFDCGTCPPPKFVIDPASPNFVANIAPDPASGETPPATPTGALVFDSFSRPNSTYLLGSRGGLGSTEGGSLGPELWQTNQAPTAPQQFGILNSMAVLLANSPALAWVQTGSAGDREVRVDRRPGRWRRGIQTGLSFRVVDANDYFFAYTTELDGTSGSQTLRVGYYLGGSRVDLGTGAMLPIDWTSLRVITMANGDLKVYADNTLIYTTNSQLMVTATGAGLYNNAAGLGLVNRWDNFTVSKDPVVQNR